MSKAREGRLVTAAIKLLEARTIQMITEAEWNALAQAVRQETGQYVEWRTRDELKGRVIVLPS